MILPNSVEKIIEKVKLKNGEYLNVLVQITDDEKELDKNLFNISLYLDSEDGRRIIGRLHASNNFSSSKEQLIIDDNIISDNFRGYGLGNFQLQYFIDYIKRKRPNIKSLYGTLTKSDLKETTHLEQYYKKNGFEVKINKNKENGSIFKLL